MRSFGRSLTGAFLWVLAAGGLHPSTVALRALSLVEGQIPGQDAESLYTDLRRRETELRRELDLAPQRRTQPPGEASAALLKRVRTAVAAYESAAGRFPRSGYSDNALWQGAVLAADAFWQFGDAEDRATALRLFALLKAQFPGSSLAVQVDGQTSRLNGAAGSSSLATLKAIRREALPDTLRVTLELENEAIFHDERLDGPPRVFIDLRNTQAVAALKDATIAYADDVVRQARIGRQADNRLRVVFDLQGAARYSVYSLYNPYRIVIDFERPAAKPPTSASSVAPMSDRPIAPISEKPIVPTAEKPIAPTSKTAAAPAANAPVAATSKPSVAPSSASGAPRAPAAANARGGVSLSRQLGLGISRIVIDPGHGGQDPGARVRGLTEAELVLDIAVRLETLLIKEGVEVTLTRRTNAYVPLEERTAIANRAGADLFLSIHANASSDTAARGFETYFLSFAPNAQAEALAARENAGSSRTMGSLPEILKAIAMNNKLDESRDFAAMLQQSLFDRLSRVDRNTRNLGVKQAPFMVLVGATMPSALAEVSFLTNQHEAALLRTTNYRQQIAEALLAGIVKYQQGLKGSAVLRSGF